MLFPYPKTHNPKRKKKKTQTHTNMKLLTANFVTCAVKTCKSSPLSFPLHFRDAELEQRELDYNPIFLANILPRLDWDAIKVVAAEVWFPFQLSRKFRLRLGFAHEADEKVGVGGEGWE